ncbi:hypothetical protein EU534_02695, partial [Candidatus Heimdallarchaeota archaeon]
MFRDKLKNHSIVYLMKTMMDYILQEVNEQPAYLENLVRQSKEEIFKVVNKIRAKKDISKIILTGCGDS